MESLELFYKLIGVDDRMYIFHTVNLLLYVYVVIHAMKTLMFTFTSRNLFKPHPNMRRSTDYSRDQICVIIRITLICIIGLSTMFVLLQWDWITSDKNLLVGDLWSILWLTFDYLNVICYICVVTAIRVGLQWISYTGLDCSDRRDHIGLLE